MELRLPKPLLVPQKRILEACELGNGIQFVVVRASRQVSKSTTCILAAIKWAVQDPGCQIIFFSPVYKQSGEIYRRLKKTLAEAEQEGLVSFVGAPKYEVTFWNGSRILLMTAENDGCRGLTATYLIIDEAAFVKDDIFYEAILPTAVVELSKPDENGIVGNKSKVLICSTPKLASGWFYKMCTSEEDNVKVIRTTSKEAGIISDKLLEQFKKQMPEAAYRNEFEGEFIESGGGMFNWKSCVRNGSTVLGTGKVAGLDIGSRDDYTVLTIQDDKGNVILQQSWRQQDMITILKSCAELLVNHGSPMLYIESNGLGLISLEEMRKLYSKTKEWNTSNSSKNDIIQRLILDFNINNITIPDDIELQRELDNYTVEWKNGKPFYGGSIGKDDRVMSLAICNFNRSKITSVKPEIHRMNNHNR